MRRCPATFYVSPLGSDSSSGLSRAEAWKKLDRVNEADFALGDQVLLEGGEVFSGCLHLCTPGITIGSTGNERATIESSETAIVAPSEGLVIRDLILKGNAKEHQKETAGILLQSGTETLSNVRLENLDISGFGGSGIVVASDGVSEAGFSELTISRCSCHDNFGHGIEVTGNNGPGYPHSDLSIQDSSCERNKSGSGIVVSGVRTGKIERCTAFDNAGPGGGVGIWAWRARDVIFSECISARTRSEKGDGGGFDLDGGCVECRIQNCVSYENDGPGYMHCDYPSAPPTHGNSIIECLSINDGRKPKGDNVGFGFVTWGSGLDGCDITACLAILTKEPPGSERKPIFFVTYVRGAETEGDELHVRKCSLLESGAFVTAPGYAIVDTDTPVDSTSVKFRNCVYFLKEGLEPVFIAGPGKIYRRLGWYKRAVRVDSSAHVLALDADASQFLEGLDDGYRISLPEEIAWLNAGIEGRRG